MGDGVTQLAVGDRVIVACISSCGKCSNCRDSLYSHCLDPEGMAGIGWILGHMIDGTQAEYARVPFAENSVYRVPEGMTDSEGILLSDILPTGFEIGVQYGRVAPGDVVAVIGSGPVGLSAVMTPRLYGPSKVIAIDLDSARLARAADWNEAYEIFYEVATAIGLAKSFGYVPEGRYPNANRLIEAQEFYAKLDEVPSDLFTELLEEALHRSIQAAYAGAIDYNDQCYMPAVFGGTFPRFPTVLVDEAQDINPCNLAMLVHLAPHSRICAVGDPWQGIYGFRGAMQGAMGRLQEQFEMTPADLTVSFRCPEAVVRNAQWRNPTLRWLKPGGRVAKLRSTNTTDFADGDAVICRNNAPLFAMAMHLLAHGRSVSVAGSDVGPKVIGIMRKLGPETLTKEQLNGAIDEWLTEKLSKDSKTATDIADCMRVFASLGRTLEDAIGYAQHLFEQSGTLTLLTGHKAKGLEWPVVYHLDPWLIGESEQELNLRYVIQTRALETYYEIESREIRWSR